MYLDNVSLVKSSPSIGSSNILGIPGIGMNLNSIDQHPAGISHCVPGSDQDPNIRFSDEWGNATVQQLVDEYLRRSEPVKGEYTYVSIPGLFLQARTSDTEEDIAEEPKLGDFWDGSEIAQRDLRMINDPVTTLQHIKLLEKIFEETLGMKLTTFKTIRHVITPHNVLDPSLKKFKEYELHQLPQGIDTSISGLDPLEKAKSLTGKDQCDALHLALSKLEDEGWPKADLTFVTRGQRTIQTDQYALQGDTEEDYKPVIMIEANSERSAFHPTDKCHTRSWLEEHYPHVVMSDSMSEADLTFQTLHTRQCLFTELAAQGYVKLPPDQWLGEEKTEQMRQQLADFHCADALADITNLIHPENLRETKIPTEDVCFAGELPNRSKRGETSVFNTLWHLHQSQSSYARMINRITHGQQSEVQRSREDMARLSSDDFEKIKTEMLKYPELSHILTAMEDAWDETRTVSNLKKMLNGQAEVTVVAFKPEDSNRSKPELAEKWLQAMADWRTRQVKVLETETTQESFKDGVQSD